MGEMVSPCSQVSSLLEYESHRGYTRPCICDIITYRKVGVQFPHDPIRRELMEENFTLTNIGWRLRAGWYKEIDLSDTYTAVPRGYLMWDIYDFPIEFEEVSGVV